LRHKVTGVTSWQTRPLRLCIVLTRI